MLSERHRQRLIADRCWELYDLITKFLTVLPEFHVKFPDVAELTVITGRLQVRVQIDQMHSPHIEEEYSFQGQELVIENYSYVLLDQDQGVVIRADPFPYHQADYKRHQLRHFPHHLHDEKGRICSFTGRIEDFVMEVVARPARH